MSRHRNVMNACRGDDYYDDYDDYYEEEDYGDDNYYPSSSYSNKNTSNKSSKPINQQTNLNNFIIEPKSKQNKNKKKGNSKNNPQENITTPIPPIPPTLTLTSSQQSFIQQAKEILGSNLSNDELIDIFTRFSGNSERAITYLLDNPKSETPSKAEDIPPGFLESDVNSASAMKYAKPPAHVSATVPVLGKSKPLTDSTPIKSHLKSSPSPNRSPAPISPFPTPPSVSRSNSGHLNRMTALSDDDWDESLVLENTLPHLTMVVAGHVDAGKSTLVGNFLFKLGSVQSRTVHKFQKNAQAQGKGSFYLAWVMDESESEREHGVTIDVAERLKNISSVLILFLGIFKLKHTISRFLMHQVIEILSQI